MKTVKENTSGIIVCLFELVAGTLLLISPATFTSGIIMVFGVVLLFSGLVSVINYFRTDAVEAAQRQILVKGLVSLLVGGFCALKSDWFAVTFDILTLICGITILVSGLGKIQWTVDMLRLKKKKWYLAAISAVASAACSLVIIANPFSATAALWMFTGICLIVEGAYDVVALCFAMRGKEKAPVLNEEKETEPEDETKEPVEAKAVE